MEASEPEKPQKPLYLTRYSDIKAVLSTPADEIVHPAFAKSDNLPNKVAKALASIKSKGTRISGRLENDDVAQIKRYFEKRTRAIVEREVIILDKAAPVFQVDVTRE